MKAINLSILIVIGFIVFSCQKGYQDPPLPVTIENKLDSLLLNTEFDAVSIGIIDGKQRYIAHKGQLLNAESPTDETLYEIASITKTFTGTLLAHAIHDNKVQLDEDIRKYLNGSFPNLAYNNQPITFHHLVTHQSGLPNMFPDVKGLFDNPDWDKLPFRINELQKDYSKEDFFEALHFREVLL